MTRSSHIAIRVPSERLEDAVAHYKTLLGVSETARKPDGVELTGANFTLYVEPGEPVVLQEFVTNEGADVRSKFEAAGCRIFDVSEFGFHVSDPYGLSYHVWIEKEASDPITPAAG